MPFLVISWLLSAMFLWAGIAKLRDREGTQRALIGFGVPATHTHWLVYVLAGAELVVAVGLLPAATAWIAAWGTLLLLLLFTSAILFNLARGRRPACHCFGQLSAAPISWRTVLRNGLLTTLAAVLVWQGPNTITPSPLALLAAVTPFQFMTLAGFIVLTLLVLVQGWFLLNLLQQNGRLLRRVDALEAGGAPAQGTSDAMAVSPLLNGTRSHGKAPPFHLHDLQGELHSLETLQSTGKALLLIFGNPNCGPCTTLLPEIAQWQRTYTNQLQIVLISRGTPAENMDKLVADGVVPILLQQANEVAEAYAVRATPSALLVLADGTRGSAVAEGPEAIRTLVNQAAVMLRHVVVQPRFHTYNTHDANGAGHGLAGHENEPLRLQPVQSLPMASRIGKAAPEFALPDLLGRTVSLSGMVGQDTVLLFWNPNCGFCERMAPDLRAWEADPPRPEGSRRPQLLIIASGTPLQNQRFNFSSPLLLDEGFQTGRLYLANGTPSAIRIDARGAIASPLAVGAPAVWNLLRFQPTVQEVQHG